ncbi:MAG TPA: hypothetical protein VMV18_01975 [bacterium]|nr:hypothetical protein [bacterium]
MAETVPPSGPQGAGGPPQIEIDPRFAKAIDPASPPPVRMMAARGIVPGAKPADILAIQYSLSFDPDANVSGAAAKALADTPPNIIRGAVTDKTHGGIIDVFARRHSGDEDLLEFLVLRRLITDDTLAYLAETTPSLKIVEIIGKNQERLLQNVKIFDALKKNPVTPKSLVDVTIAFLQMAGVLPMGAEARAAGLPDRIDSKLVEQVIGDEEFDESLTSEASSDVEASEEEKKTLTQKIAAMNRAQRIKLAFKANKEARGLLLRDSSRQVVDAVLNSGRMTDPEVIALAMNPVTQTEVLRSIDKNRDWTKTYVVQKALATNPKTPQAIAMKWIKQLRFGDMQAAARSTNVPPAIRAIARQIIEEKQKNR